MNYKSTGVKSGPKYRTTFLELYAELNVSIVFLSSRSVNYFNGISYFGAHFGCLANVQG